MFGVLGIVDIFKLPLHAVQFLFKFLDASTLGALLLLCFDFTELLFELALKLNSFVVSIAFGPVASDGIGTHHPHVACKHENILIGAFSEISFDLSEVNGVLDRVVAFGREVRRVQEVSSLGESLQVLHYFIAFPVNFVFNFWFETKVFKSSWLGAPFFEF